MALSTAHRDAILSQLSPQYRELYAAGELTDTHLEMFANQIGLSAPADFSGVSSSARSTAVEPQAEAVPEAAESAGLMDVLNNLTLVNPRNIGAAASFIGDPNAREAVVESARSGGAGLLSAGLALQEQGAMDAVDPLGMPLPVDTEFQSQIRDAGLTTSRQAQEEAAMRSQEALGRMAPGVGHEVIETVTDIASSPESFASTLGPAGGILAMLGQLGRNIDSADAAGLSREEATAYAAVKTSPAVLEFLPGMTGKFTKRNVDDLTNSLFANILKRGAAEGTTEVLQSAAEMGIDKGLATYADNEQIREHALTQVPESTAQFFDNLYRSFRAGGVAGSAIATPGEVMTAMADAGRRAGEFSAIVPRAEARANIADAARSTEITPTAPELTREQEIEAAYAQRDTTVDPAIERARNAEAQRASLANRVDNDRQQVEMLQERIENGDTSQSTFAAMTRAMGRLRQSEQLYNNQVARMEPVAPAPVEAPAAVEAGPVQGPAAPTTEQVKAREDARKAAADMIKKDSDKSKKNAASARSAARNKFLREQRDQLVAQGVEGDTLVDRVADARISWDAANPVESFMPAPKTAAKPAAQPAQQPTVAEETAVEEEQEQTYPVSTLDDLSRELMSQKSNAPGSTGVTVQQVADTFKRDAVSADAGRFAGLLADGNVEVVRTKDDIIEQDTELLPQGKGYYDPARGKVYVVADQLDPDNIRGDTMSVLSHEVKHAADRGGFTPTRGSLKNLIGEKNNDQVVKQIEALAKQNTPIGRRTAEMLEQVRRDYDEATLNEEIPANFINLAMAERTGPGRNIISALRTRYKELTGNNDLNLNDIKYLADQLVREAAQTGNRFKGQADGQGRLLPMIVGPQHPRFEEFRQQGRVYTGPEGNERAVVSDVGSRVNLDDLTRRVLESDRNVPIPLPRMLQHEELYEAYPQLRDLNVIVDPTVEDFGGWYREGTNTIALSRAHIAELLQGAKGIARVRGTLLHEVQHAIQGYEGNARGASVEQFYTNSDRMLMNRYGKANEELLQLIEGVVRNPESVDGLDPATVSELRQIGQVFDTSMNEGVIGDVISVLREDDSRIARTRIKEIQKADEKVKSMMPEVEARKLEAENKYYDSYGELEAYWTEATRNLPQEDLPINPDRNVPTGFRDTGVQRRDRQIVNLPGSGSTILAQRTPSRDQTFEWAEEYFGDAEVARNFTNWFRESKVVNDDGTPMIMYHGTYADTDFVTFIPGEYEVGIHVGTVAQANDPAFVGQAHSPNALTKLQADRAPRIIPLFVRIENPLTVNDVFGKGPIEVLTEVVNMHKFGRDSQLHDNRNNEINDVPGAQQMLDELLSRPDTELTHDDVRGFVQMLGYDGLRYRNEVEGVRINPSLVKGDDSLRSDDPSSRLYNPYATDNAEYSYVVLSSNQLKSTTGNSGEFANSQLSILRQAPAATATGGRVIPQAATADKAMSTPERLLRRLFAPGGGYPPAMAEAMQAARNMQSSSALKADKLALDFARAIKRNTIKIDGRETALFGMTEEQAREAVLKRLDAIDELPTRKERNAALDELNREFPTIGEAVRKIRDLKLEYTQQLFDLRKRDPRDLTEKERNIFKKMAENAERYTTRAYLATYNQEVGKSYGRRLVETARRDPNSREARVIGDAIDYLVQNELMIPDQAGLNAMSIGDLRRTYTHWGLGDADKFKGSTGKKAIIEELEAYRSKANGLNLEAKAMAIIEDMLGLSGKRDKRRMAVSRGAKQNRTILEGRTDLPQELRTLLGEVTDPVVRESLSLARMSNLVSKTRLLTEIYEGGRNKWWSDVQSPKYNFQLNGEAYGPMNGKWVDQNGQDAITGMVSVDQSMDMLLTDMVKNPDAFPHLTANIISRGIRKLMRMQKMVQVVINPMNMAFNLVGSPALLLANGVNPKYVGKAMQNTVRALSYDVGKRLASDAGIEAAQELIEAGAIDSASMGEFQGDMYQTIVKEMKKLTDGGKTPTMVQIWRATTAVTGVGRDGVRQAYAFMDVWTKAATYYARKDFLSEFYKAEGITKTETELRREAGRVASGTNISYERAIPLARMLEQNTPIAMFLTYFTETFRATGMNYIQAYRDTQLARTAKTPEGRALATTEAIKRAVGTSTLLAGVIGGTLAALNMEDEDEKKMRALDPEWLQDTVLVPIGVTADGKVEWMPLNRLDPLGPLNEFVIKVLNANMEDKPEAIAQGILDMFVTAKSVQAAWQVIVDMSAAMGLGEDTKRNKNTLTEKNFPEAYNFLTSLRNDGDVPENLIAAIETIGVPSVVAGQFDDTRNALGYRPHVRDPHKSLGFRIWDYKKATKELRTEFTDYMKNPDRTSADVARRMTAVLRDEREHYDTLNEALEGFLASPKDQLDVTKGKLSRSEAAKIFKDERQAALLPALIRGRFVSSAVKAEDLTAWYKTQAAKPGADRAALRKEYETMLAVYRGSLNNED